MPTHVRDSGSWRTLSSIRVRVAGTWQTISSGWIRVGGAWRQFHGLDSIVANWADLVLTWPTTSGANADLALSWSIGGARNISATYAGSGTLQYRINSGAWTTYSSPFSVASGQALGWRYSQTNFESSIVTVRDDARGATIDTFVVSSTGSP